MKFKRPTLLVDEIKCRKNIEKMATKAKDSGVLFRPHFKTHQSAAIGDWFRDYGVEKITVSSVVMAEYFARNGWNDILVSFPVNILEIEAINHLAAKVSLHLLVESEFSASFLAQNLSDKAGVYVKIDTGNHRTGLSPDNLSDIKKIVQIVSRSDKMTLNGLLAHDGHTYKAGSPEEIIEIHKHSVRILSGLKSELEKDFRIPVLSLGDTPSCSIVERFEGIDEIRPGNFVFYDVMQYELGACFIQDIAVAVACPVVAVHAQRNEIVIHGGAVHLSKESLERDGKHYGWVVPLSDRSWGLPYPDCYVASVSQEHGLIKASDQLMRNVGIGDMVGILPVHSCLTANLFRVSFVDKLYFCEVFNPKTNDDKNQ
jgi:D-serine deaminase-like pyridoxal phosphate-dependent protein